MSTRTRNWLIAVGVLVVALVAFLLLRGERSWAVAISADPGETLPWLPVRLTADLQGAPKDATKDKSGWQFKWSCDDGTVESMGATAVWRGGSVGTQHVQLRVTSPAGTVHLGSVDFEVDYPKSVRRDGFDGKGDGMQVAAPPQRHESPVQITEVTVEKSEVCAGEPSMVKVKANNHGTDQDLLFLIDGQAGDAVPYVRFTGKPGLRRVNIRVIDKRHDDVYQETSAFIALKDCKQDLAMLVKSESAPPTPDEYKLKVGFIDAAHVDDIVPGSLDVVQGQRPRDASIDPRIKEFHWDFGDGQTATSAETTINHVFPHEYDRPDRLETTYVVKVEAVDDSGAVLSRGNLGLMLQSSFNEMKHRFKKLELSAEYVPSPTHAEGTYTETVTLMNPDREETANLSNLSFDYRDCTGESVETKPVSPTSVFSTGTLGPRDKIEGRMVVSEADMKSRCFVHVTIDGTSSPSNLQVEGFFLMRLEGGVGSATISDPNKVAAVNEAMKILGKSFVSDQDIQRLEEQGQIKPGLLTPPTIAATGLPIPTPPPPVPRPPPPTDIPPPPNP